MTSTILRASPIAFLHLADHARSLETPVIVFRLRAFLPSYSSCPQIANVGFLDVDQQTVRKAIEHDTLFIHGSLTGGGGSMFKASVTGALARKTMLRGGGQSSDECTDACGRAESSAAAHGGSSVCDRTCYAGKGGARFGGFMCGAGDASKYGKQCRMCYLDLEEARKAQRLLLEEFVEGRGVEELKHVVMCETLLPPTPSTCSAKCAMKDDTVSPRRWSS